MKNKNTSKLKEVQYGMLKTHFIQINCNILILWKKGFKRANVYRDMKSLMQL